MWDWRANTCNTVPVSEVSFLFSYSNQLGKKSNPVCFYFFLLGVSQLTCLEYEIRDASSYRGSRLEVDALRREGRRDGGREGEGNGNGNAVSGEMRKGGRKTEEGEREG